MRFLLTERGTLEGELIACTFGTYNETLASEQYFHKSNRDFRLAGLFRDLKVTQKPAGGHSEFFNMPEKTAKAKFANAQRQTCKNFGMEIVNWKRKTEFTDAQNRKTTQPREVTHDTRKRSGANEAPLSNGNH